MGKPKHRVGDRVTTTCENPRCGVTFTYVCRGPRQFYCTPRCAHLCRTGQTGATGRQVKAAAKRKAGGRRHGIDPATCEPDYTADEFEFFKAMEAYKKAARRPFPTLRETLEVVRSLGYRKPDTT